MTQHDPPGPRYAPMGPGPESEARAQGPGPVTAARDARSEPGPGDRGPTARARRPSRIGFPGNSPPPLGAPDFEFSFRGSPQLRVQSFIWSKQIRGNPTPGAQGPGPGPRFRGYSGLGPGAREPVRTGVRGPDPGPETRGPGPGPMARARGPGPRPSSELELVALQVLPNFAKSHRNQP